MIPTRRHPLPLSLLLIPGLILGGALAVACSAGSTVTAVDADAGPDAGSSTEGASCRVSSECKPGFEQCLGPGAFGGCGVAAGGNCDTDEDCKNVGNPPALDAGADGGDGGEVEAGPPPARLVCAPPGACQQRGSCAPPCTSDQQCGSTPEVPRRCVLSTGKCELVQCSSDAECAVNFRCSDGPVRLCTRRSCTTDAECKGACVDKLCYSGIGKCTPLPQ
ncbi:MAG: hypothetical protein JST00_26060 [Deltaproteobacteria bacterium]|nr:hypothetical protein [Deltaproteobacteria bacterium]